MKVLFLALFVAAVAAAPMPEDSGSDAVEMIVNGVPDGAALEVSNIVDIKLNEHAGGEVVSATNLLHPYTAFGIAEAAAAVANAGATIVNDMKVVDNDMARKVLPLPIVAPSPVVPEPVVMPSPAVPEVVVPEPVVMPSPAIPEVVVPEPVVMPSPAKPEIEVKPEELPIAAAQYNGELYNDGIVQVQYNGPEEPSVLSTLQSWFNLVVNYFNGNSEST